MAVVLNDRLERTAYQIRPPMHAALKEAKRERASTANGSSLNWRMRL
jgi:hypothetical protein